MSVQDAMWLAFTYLNNINPNIYSINSLNMASHWFLVNLFTRIFAKVCSFIQWVLMRYNMNFTISDFSFCIY